MTTTDTQLGPYSRLVLLGGGEVVRMLCEWAPSNGYAISVITSPRHALEELDGQPFQTFLEARGINYLVAEKIDTPAVHAFIGDTQETFFLSLGAAWLFKAEVTERVFDNKLYNSHGTRLPQNRGGGGFSWQILTANRFGFCVLHQVDGGIDTGDIIATDEFLYPASGRIPADFERVYIAKNFAFIAGLLAETLGKTKAVKPVAQQENFSSYWPRLSTATHAWIDWSNEPQHIERFICAFDSPYAGAQTYLDGKLVHLKGVSVNLQDGIFHPYQAGLIYRINAKWLCVCLSGAALIVEEVLDENGEDIFPTIRVGDRFLTPATALDSSKERVIFTPNGIKSPLHA